VFDDQSNTMPHVTTTTDTAPTEEAVTLATSSGDGEQPAHAAGLPTTSVQTSDALQHLLEEMQALRREFQTKLLHDDAKQRQLDALHAELQEHRRGMHFQLLRPVFTDLIALLDDMASVSTHHAHEPGDGSAASSLSPLDQIREHLLETLERNGVQAYTSADSVFDRERQRAIAVVETSDPALDKRVAVRVRPGYLYDGRIVVRAEQVKTYRYTPPADACAPPSEE
jgi:molecular chaperone GrpE (heat shock protein)